MSWPVVGTHIYGCLQLGNGIVKLTFFKGKNAEIVEGNIVVFCNSKRMGEQGFAIAPVRCLHPCAPTKSTKYENCSSAQKYPLKAPRAGQIGYRPGHRYIKADLRQISVAVCVSLPSNL